MTQLLGVVRSKSRIETAIGVFLVPEREWQL